MLPLNFKIQNEYLTDKIKPMPIFRTGAVFFTKETFLQHIGLLALNEKLFYLLLFYIIYTYKIVLQ